jgi:hypothetical protein
MSPLQKKIQKKGGFETHQCYRYTEKGALAHTTKPASAPVKHKKNAVAPPNPILPTQSLSPACISVALLSLNICVSIPRLHIHIMLGSKSLLMNQPSVVLSVWMLSVGERRRLPASAHAALIWSCDARVPVRRKRETGVAVASTSEVTEAVMSATTLEAALRMSETIGATPDAAGAESLAVRLTVKVPLKPTGAALLKGQFEIGTVSTIVVFMITSLVM